MSTPTLRYTGRAGVVVDLDRLLASRMLATANSGAGKSRALRQLLEETHGRVQHLVLDPEGEFATLREAFDYVLAAKTGGDVEASPKTARLLCRRLVELGASAILDLYDLSLQERREFVKLFLTELMALPRGLWRPILVVIDEAHVFCPERGSGEAQSTEAVITLATQGRKRGFALVAATQRISKLHKDCAAELLTKMVGRTGLDVDLKRAGDELGLDKEGRQALKSLAPGEFYVYGPAISNEVQRVRTGDVKTTHPEAGRVGSAPPPASKNVKALLARLADLPQQAALEARTIADYEVLVKQLRGDLRRAQQGAPGVDRAELERQVTAAVEKARAGWTRDMRRLVDRELSALGGTIDRAKKLADQVPALFDSIGARFLALAGTIDMQADSSNRKAPEGTPASGHPAQGNAGWTPASATTPTPERTRVPVPRARQEAAPVVPADGVTAPQQRILDALASFEQLGLHQVAKSNVAVFSDQSPRSSGFANNLGRLRTLKLIDYPAGGTVALTAAGRAVASASPITSVEELHAAWESKLPRPQWTIVDVLRQAYPDAVDREALAERAGQSPTSSGYANNLGALRSLGLIDYQPGRRVVATALLFPEGF